METRLASIHNKRARRDVIAIGASAGGIEALCELLGGLPSDLPAVVLITQHRPLGVESHLRSILARHSSLPVEIVRSGQELKYGHCYISRPDRHLTVDRKLCASLLEDQFYRSHSVDALFNSVAHHAGARAIGVILSGMLKDGANGLKAITEAGGVALVQDPSTAAYDEMPLAAIRFGDPIDLVGPIAQLSQAIRHYTAGHQSAVPIA